VHAAVSQPQGRLDLRTLVFFNRLQSSLCSLMASQLFSFCGDLEYEAILQKYNVHVHGVLSKGFLVSRMWSHVDIYVIFL